jgi:hypothetical protein
MVYRRAKDRCEACGAGRDPDVGKWLEAHERWEYDETTRTQWLKRIVCLCTFCHEVTHYGFACVRGRDELALRHLMYVNRWSGRRAKRHVEEAFQQWERRSQTQWSLDLDMLLNAGIRVREPPDVEDRDKIASALEASIGRSDDVLRPRALGERTVLGQQLFQSRFVEAYADSRGFLLIADHFGEGERAGDQK